MMVLHIEATDFDQAVRIAEALLSKKLIYDVSFFKADKSTPLQNGDTNEGEKTVLSAKSKSILYHSIEEELKLMFGENLPTMFSQPIIQMPPEQFAAIRSETEKL